MSATVAIVICAYNDAEYIGRVVCGAVQQDLPGREIIVVDDCSTDGTGQVLEDIPDIKVIRNEKNMGLAATLTRGVAATDASIVISLHSDCLLRDSGWLARWFSCLMSRMWERLFLVVSTRIDRACPSERVSSTPFARNNSIPRIVACMKSISFEVKQMRIGER